MTLDDYLRMQGLTLAQFAKDAGLVGKQIVHQYRHGLRFPTPANLRRIREATNGAVTADDFVDQHAGASPRFTSGALSRPATPKLRAKRSQRSPVTGTHNVV